MTQVIYSFDNTIKQTIQLLRLQKHQAGFPFMIESRGELNSNQAFMEYANGIIEVVEFDKEFRSYSFVRRLSSIEASEIRQKYLFGVQ